MYQILQKFDIHWHDGGPSIAMMCHLRRVSDLLYNWKSCLLCYMKDVVLHCSIFFKWNKLVRVRVSSSSSCICPTNERRRYNVTSSLIGWAHTQNDPCCHFDVHTKYYSDRCDINLMTSDFHCNSSVFFFQQLVDSYAKENMEASHYWPLVRRVHRWIPSSNASNVENVSMS